MSKTSFRILIGAGILMAIAIALLLTVNTKKEPSSMHDAVQHVEDYRKKNGKLPDPNDLQLLNELQITQVDGLSLSYEKIDEQNFLLIRRENPDAPQWYYDSRNKKWAHGEPSR